MTQQKLTDAQWLQHLERERLLQQPPALREVPAPPTLHWSELSADTAGGEFAREWTCYLTHVAQLLADGQEGRWIIIEGERILGIWDTEEAAQRARQQQLAKRPVLLRQIREREPMVRGGGYGRRWLI